MSAVEHYEKYFDVYRDQARGILQCSRSADDLETLQDICSHADIKPGLKVLDCGGGLGLPAAYIASQGCKVDSLNITPMQLAFARENFGNLVNFIELSFEKMDQLPGKYDRLLFLESIGHVANLGKLMKQAYEKLESGGLLYIKHPCVTGNHKHFADLEKFYCYKFYSPLEIVQAAESAGLMIKDVSSIRYRNYDVRVPLNFIEQTKSERGAEIDSTSLDSKRFVFIKGAYHG